MGRRRRCAAKILVPLKLALVSSIGSATAGQMTLSRAVARELLHGLEPVDAGGRGS